MIEKSGVGCPAASSSVPDNSDVWSVNATTTSAMFCDGCTSNGTSDASISPTRDDFKIQFGPAGVPPGTDPDKKYRPGVTPSNVNVPSAAIWAAGTMMLIEGAPPAT